MKRLKLEGVLFLCTCLSLFSAPMILTGLVPPDINRDNLAAEYSRIWHMLAPDRIVDERPVHLDFYSRSGSDAQAAVLPEWGGGGALGEDRIIIPIDQKPFLGYSFYQTAVHELAHLVLARVTHGTQLPRWFHEGVATVMAGDITFDGTVSLSTAFMLGRAPRFDAIESINGRGRLEAAAAYSLAHQSVTLFVKRYGIESLAALIDSTRRLHNFESGLRAEIGLTSQEFEAQVRSELHQKFGALIFFSDSFWFWGVGFVLFIAALVVARIRKGQRMQDMSVQETVNTISEDEKSSDSVENQTVPDNDSEASKQLRG